MSSVKVKRVVNRSGPQMSSHMTAAVQMCEASVFVSDAEKRRTDPVAVEREGISERLNAIESALKLESGKR